MLLGIDVGTTAVKALLVDAHAQPVAEAGLEYPISQPAPGWSQQDAEDWWRCVCAATRHVSAGAGSPMVALEISTLGDTAVPVDAQGQPLGPARTWMDTRTASLVPALEAELAPDEWFALTGSRLGPFAAALTPLWWRESHPEVLRKTARFALVEDFLVQRLTGSPLLSHPNASRTVAFGLRALDWSDRLLGILGLDRTAFSPAAPSGTIAGNLTRDSAGALGLSPDCLVVLGGHDQTCAAVGAGVVRPGSLMLSTGTAWVLLACTDGLVMDFAEHRAQTYRHAAPGRWALLTAQAGGNVFAWARGLISCDPPAYEDLVQQAQDAESGAAGAVLLLPHFYGAASPPWMRNARGMLAGLTLGHSAGDLYLGVLRGIALETARNLETFRAIGAAPEEVRMIGGGARSEYWAQTVADFTGTPVVLPVVREAAAYGAALLAGVASGVLPDLEAAVAKTPIAHRCEPDPSAQDFCRGLEQSYLDMIAAMRPVWERIAATIPPQ
ncbi:MAG: FGGY family carbohydrate kinase [Acidobacteriota bacterium]|nr:FGGY family carbohydrate kinase [Acidobacteriota bacterium]